MSYVVSMVASTRKPSLAFVIPVKDEQATLADLFRGIAVEATKVTDQWEVIFVDDGSTDASWSVIGQLAAENSEHVKGIRFRCNAGKAAALAAGWKASTGDIVFTMDADLQDDPEEIPRFLEKINEGYDVVTGWKRDRHDPWHKVLPSRIFNFILSRVNKVELHDHNCGFKCYRREVVQSVPMYGEMHRMVPSLAAMQGFRTAEIPVKHHPRRHGRSKYGLKRFLRGFLDMWTVFFLQNFRQRPMHLMGAVSILMMVFGCFLALFLARVPLPISVFMLLSSALPALLIGAVMTAMIGLLAEWNVHQNADISPHPIAETIGRIGATPIAEISSKKSLTNGEMPLVATALLLDDKPETRELNAAQPLGNLDPPSVPSPAENQPRQQCQSQPQPTVSPAGGRRILIEKCLLTRNRVLAAIGVPVGLVLAAGAFVLWPAHKNAESRFYTSGIGFLTVQRLLGIPMEAEAAHPVLHDFATPVLGEGTLQCDFYNVPVVPVARITALHVEEGDHVEKGQLLAELDDTDATLNLHSAQLALANATAERQRVGAGTLTTMVAERPDKNQVSIEGLKKIMEAAQAKVAIVRKLAGDGSSSRLDLVNAEMDLATAQMNYNQAQVDAGMSTAGFPQSNEIAQNAVDDAQNLVTQREYELKYCHVTAPASGTIDRVLIRNGEYNQTAGNPGFIIASGLWFDANLDQRALAEVREGMEATVNLEAYSGRDFPATVEGIVPIVTFDAGGPETKTPVRPLGTGSPEWPATFTVRLRLADPGVKVAPGMTGFVRVVSRRRRALAVPREAISSQSAGKGVVRIVDDSGHPVTTPVTLGDVDAGFVEITGGLDASNWVLTNNPRLVRDDDKIHITRLTASQETEMYGGLAATQPDVSQVQLKDTGAGTQQTEKKGELAGSQRDALQAQLKEMESKAQKAQQSAELAANQRDALQARLEETEAKLGQAQKNGELVASQRDALQARLKESEAKAQRAQENVESATGQRDALQAQLKEAEAKAQKARENAELAASQRDALQAQLKESEANAQQARESAKVATFQADELQAQLKEIEAKAQLTQKNGDLEPGQSVTMETQLKEAEAKAQKAQKNAELATSQRDALEAQLKDAEAKAERAQESDQRAASQRDALQARLQDAEAKAEQAQKNGELAGSQRDALQAQLRDTEAKAEQAQKNGELAASQRDALQAQLKDAEAKAEQAQKNGELAASQRDALQAQLKDTETKAEQAQKNGELAASQRDALQAQLKDLEAKAEQAQKNGELAASQRDALQAQLKDLEAKAEQAQKNGELAASQRDALQAQLKDAEAKAEQAQKNGELAGSQHDALLVQLRDTGAKAEQAQKNNELAASQRDALQAQLRDFEAKAEQAQKNNELTASQREALQAQLKAAEEKAQQAQKNGELTASQRDALQAQLKETQAKAEQAQKNGELTASQRDALQAELKNTQAKAEQARKIGEIAASQRDALQAELKDTQAKAEQARKIGEIAASQRDALQAELWDAEVQVQQAQKDGELTTSQRDALQTQLRNTQAKAEQAEKDAELAANQRDALQAQLKDTEARVREAENIATLAQAQPNTGTGSTGETTQNPVPTNSAQKIGSATPDDQASDPDPATSGRASSESKKGRHAIRHRTAARRENGGLRVIGRWLRRHLPLASD